MTFNGGQWKTASTIYIFVVRLSISRNSFCAEKAVAKIIPFSGLKSATKNFSKMKLLGHT